MESGKALLVCRLIRVRCGTNIMLSLARSLRFCRVSQPRFDIISVTRLVRPSSFLTNLAALLWTISILSLALSVDGAQAVAAYSTMGRTNVLYAVSLQQLVVQISCSS